MKSKYFKFLLCLLISIILIIASSPFVFAASSTILTNPYQQPQLNGNNGYIELLYQNGDGSFSNALFIWDCLDGENRNSVVNVTINAHSIQLAPIYSSGGGAFTVTFVDSSGYKEFSNQLYVPGITYTFNSGATFRDAHIYGNYNIINFNISNPPITNFEIIYAGDIQLVTDVNLILKQLQSNNQALIDTQKENTDKLINAGSDKGQPDFGATNGKLDDTVGQIESIEGSYQIDQAATNTALSTGTNFLKGTDMQRASIQVKTWIEKFTSDSPVVSGFLVSAMVLGLCFWVIGRKAGSK